MDTTDWLLHRSAGIPARMSAKREQRRASFARFAGRDARAPMEFAACAAKC